MADTPTVTMHAALRYQERVANVSLSAAFDALTGPAFIICNAMGGGAVILPTGHRAVCRDGSVVTVLPHGSKWFGSSDHA